MAIVAKSKKSTLFASLKERAKSRTEFKHFVLEDEDLGTINFRLRPVTMNELLKSSSVIPSYFAGMRGKSAGDDVIEDDEELTNTVLDNLEVSRVVVCLAAQIETEDEQAFISIVDKPFEECADDEMPVEAFSNNQLGEIAAEIMGRIRFR